MLNVNKTGIEDVLIITPNVFEDERGYFFEVFNEKEFNEKTDGKYNFHTRQANESHSVGNVFRGLHFQRGEHAQAKLVRCTRGSVIDFAVDLRDGSPTFGKFEYCVLTAKNKTQFFIPKGFAHGFLVLSREATFNYLCDEGYCKESEGGVKWDDPAITTVDGKTTLADMVNQLIDTPELDLVVSKKDQEHPLLKDAYAGFNDKTLPYSYTHNEIEDQGYGIQQ